MTVGGETNGKLPPQLLPELPPERQPAWWKGYADV